MASIDFEGDILRIIQVLKANLNIYDTSNPQGKLTEIKFGEQRGGNQDKATITPPFVVITTPIQPFITNDSLGIGDNSSDPQKTILYEIKIFASGSLPEDAEQNLYFFIKEIVDTLQNNPRGKDPIPLNDPKWIRSTVKPIQQNQTNKGKVIQNATITIQCQIGSQFTVTLPGSLTLDLISIPNSPEGFNFDESFIDSQKRVVDPSTEKGTILMEYDNNSTNESAILALLGTTDNITLTKNGNSRIIKVAFIETNPTPKFDELERAILHVEKTN